MARWVKNPLQCSYLENPMDRGAWWATVHRAAKSQTQLKRLRDRTLVHTHTHTKLKKVKIMCSGDFFFQFFFSLLTLVWNDLGGTDCQR